MALPRIHGTGNLTADPELRYTHSGKAVANFDVAFNNRKKVNGEWQDGETTFLRVSVWEAQAENVASTLSKGSKVDVSGVLQQRNWEDKEGNKRTSFEVGFADISIPVPKHANDNNRGNGGGASNPSAQNSDPFGSEPMGDPFGGLEDEPPF